MRDIRMQYVIKSVASDNVKALETLLNEMSQAGWDLYSMHEVEADEGFQYNCIFVSDGSSEKVDEFDDEVVNITTFKSQMERMLSSTQSPYEACKEIQEKIREQRKKINKIKTQLEAQTESPISKNRKHLNDEMSNGLKELDNLRQQLIKTISPDLMYSKIRQEKLSICLSEEVLDLVNPDMDASLVSETVKIRQKIAEELGYVIPKIIFEDDDKLNSYEFSIKIRGQEALKSYVYPGYLMFFEDELNLTKKQKDAIYSEDLITGTTIVWIEEKKTKSFWQKGLTPSEFIARLLEDITIKYIDDLLDYSDINQYMEIVSEKNMFLIENVIPDFISVAELRYLLVNLLKERISIKDIIYIFEKINDYSDEVTKEDLLDKIRLSLSRYICKKAANENGIIQGLEISEKTFQNLFSKIDSEGNIVRIDGKKVEKIATNILKKVKTFELDETNINLFVPLEVRHMMFVILSQFIANIRILAREEISSEYTIEIVDEF